MLGRSHQRLERLRYWSAHDLRHPGAPRGRAYEIMICGKCKRDLPPEAFFASSKYWCKECRSSERKKRYRKNPEKYRATQKRYGETHRDNENAKKAAWRRAHPLQTKAGHTLRNAVMRGKIVKPMACELCNRIAPLHGHHQDYSRPLEVQWLCVTCHEEKHHGNALRSSGEDHGIGSRE